MWRRFCSRRSGLFVTIIKRTNINLWGIIQSDFLFLHFLKNPISSNINGRSREILTICLMKENPWSLTKLYSQTWEGKDVCLYWARWSMSRAISIARLSLSFPMIVPTNIFYGCTRMKSFLVGNMLLDTNIVQYLAYKLMSLFSIGVLEVCYLGFVSLSRGARQP